MVASRVPAALKVWMAMLDPDLVDVITTIEGCGDGSHRAWVVGGAVRDALAGVAPVDVDVGTTVKPDELVKVFPRSILTGQKYGTITVRHKGAVTECSVLRTSPPCPVDGRRQADMALAETLLEDLAARDFTINAMAVDVHRGLLYDPFGGAGDCSARVLRAVSDPPSLMLRADGLRTLRAYRFLSALAPGAAAWQLDPALAAALKEAAPLLGRISRERVRKELKLILESPRAPEVARRMASDGVLEAVLRAPRALAPGGRELRALECLWRDRDTAQTLAASRREELPDSLRDDPLAVPIPPSREQPFDFYAVMDLEATCWGRGAPPKGHTMEVIELPVVLIDARAGGVAAEFHTFVRPLVHPELSDFCRDLTGISQAEVDAAPTFEEAAARLVAWLGEQTRGATVAFVADGPWDLEDMLPRQWCTTHGQDAELPSVFQARIDVREAFHELYPGRRTRRAGKIEKMCRALAVTPVGPAHSGLADARNVARIALALMADGGVLAPAGTATAGDSVAGQEPVSQAGGPRDGAQQKLFLEALSLLLARVPGAALSRTCKEMKLSNDERKFIGDHVHCLGCVPDGGDAGEVRRCITARGEAWASVHWRLERAWAEALSDPEERAAALSRLEAAVSTAGNLRPGSLSPQPLAAGRWIMEKTGLRGGGRLGGLKEWLYYTQVDRDLQELDELVAVLDQLDWANTPPRDMPAVTWPPGRPKKFRTSR